MGGEFVFVFAASFTHFSIRSFAICRVFFSNFDVKVKKMCRRSLITFFKVARLKIKWAGKTKIIFHGRGEGAGAKQKEEMVFWFSLYHRLIFFLFLHRIPKRKVWIRNMLKEGMKSHWKVAFVLPKSNFNLTERRNEHWRYQFAILQVLRNKSFAFLFLPFSTIPKIKDYSSEFFPGKSLKNVLSKRFVIVLSLFLAKDNPDLFFSIFGGSFFPQKVFPRNILVNFRWNYIPPAKRPNTFWDSQSPRNILEQQLLFLNFFCVILLFICKLFYCLN